MVERYADSSLIGMPRSGRVYLPGVPQHVIQRGNDRAALFQTYFGGAERQYFYLLKVVNPGVFRAGPARVEPMYQPGIVATTEPKNLEVK